MDVTVHISKAFEGHIDAAVTRLGYLYPAWEIVLAPGVVKVTNVTSNEAQVVRREVNYALYRERIRSEGAPLRELLLKSIMT